MAVGEIGVEELAQRLAAGAVLVDVREHHEWADAHIDGAVHVPLGSVPERLDAFRGEGPVLVICKVGGRSLRACEYVATVGIEAVNVAGGMVAWMQAGLPVRMGEA